MRIEAGMLPSAEVRSMFDPIAQVYDVMNHAMTPGLDRRWRRLAAQAVVAPRHRVLDACCGTRDLSVAALKAGGAVVGLDFSRRMLDRARRKSTDIDWVEGDLRRLPFQDASFDAATVGFGVRNVEDLRKALRELRRVLRSGLETRLLSGGIVVLLVGVAA